MTKGRNRFLGRDHASLDVLFVEKHALVSECDSTPGLPVPEEVVF
jgi:hypothetical protein